MFKIKVGEKVLRLLRTEFEFTVHACRTPDDPVIHVDPIIANLQQFVQNENRNVAQAGAGALGAIFQHAARGAWTADGMMNDLLTWLNLAATGGRCGNRVSAMNYSETGGVFVRLGYFDADPYIQVNT
jgi:hypothetical protein